MTRGNGLTRQAILSAIKRRGSATTDELGDEMNISSVAVRQHLSALEAEGRIELVVVRRGLGRPVHRYSISERGDETFPRSYDRFGIDLLDSVTVNDGHEAVNRLLGMLRSKRVDEARSRVDGLDLQGQVAEIARMQEADGYMAHVDSENGGLKLVEQNCALCRVSRRFPAVCDSELAMFRDLVGPLCAVNRERHIHSGDPACVFCFTSTEATA